ncbi:SCO family protein [Litoribacter ruber]|uniref:SCO family protein n=1 Tax=Litoribacter ruber TaxID=702568 RepID=A0AAP2CE48_9BACT|nr:MULTISPECIES: SCO family protein [Litoribacter]MBS9522646.1 SCO family protein [Litoribacter alkaliphilus]MBT0811175.1 SCO family protein [Litoribacter ruber]
MKPVRVLQFMVLMCILMIPVLIIVFLRTFGTNNYEIPVYYENGVDNAYAECPVSDEQHYIPEFTFTSHLGEAIGREDMKDKVTIVDFFFTSCPSICPAMSNEMERVQDAFRDNDDVQIYSISIDPEYDQPEVLAEYAERHLAKPGKWHFLHGDKDQVYDLAKCGFILPTIDGMGEPDDFVHSDKFVLIDGEGRIRGYYSGTTREQVDELILETKILLNGSK